MNYNILYDDAQDDLITRLLKIRNIEDNIKHFLNPTFSHYRIDPYLLSDMDKAVDRIVSAIKKNEKIMIFGDYDVDGITASSLLFEFFTKFLNYKNISVRLPNRLSDWYGIKNHHLDEIKKKWVSLVITVDNGITAIQEADYARQIWLDLIITDHHKALDQIPNAFAVVNPQISPNYPFKGIAWVWVAFKLVAALAAKLIKDKNVKLKLLQYLLPIVAIGTVADVVPLVNENRLFVKLGLEYINQKKGIPISICHFIDYLNLSKIDTFHIGFMIAPRLNAWWRVQTPYDSLFTLISKDKNKQKCYLDKIENLNNERKKLQDQAFKLAEKQIDLSKKILFVADESFHEGIVGIVAWKLTEKYNRPSIVLSIKPEQWIAVGSLRWPEYFNIMEMLYEVSPYLDKFGWHKQAGWLTIKLENLSKAQKAMEQYCENKISDQDLEKTIDIDTKIYPYEWNNETLSQIEKLAPFGEGNPEPVFLLENLIIQNIEKVGKNGNGHLKLYTSFAGKQLEILFWGKGDQINNFQRSEKINIVGKVKKDNYSDNFYINWLDKLDN